MTAEYRDLGTMRYEECLHLQRQLFGQVLEEKSLYARPESAGYILAVEHPAVYTLGKSGRASNLLIDERRLAELGAEFFHIDRGGDITFHGPGQTVCYPILDLDRIGIGIRDYVAAIEETVIRTLAHYGMAAHRSAGASGVWMGDAATGDLRKICALGIRASRWVTMHGFALNVATDLKYFQYINPCGFADRGTTSMERELGHAPDTAEVKKTLIDNFEKLLNVKIYK